MKKRKLLLLLIPLMLTSCQGGEKPPFDDDDMFGPGEDGEVCVPELKDDTSTNYSFDETVKNNGGATYEIFVRSFYDTNGDGIGDFNGVTEKLDYLADLGINNIWLMPFNESPSYHGYDVSDYYSVESDYGTFEDFKRMTSEAEKRGIDIYMDFVVNHSSSENEWFKQSAMDFYTNNTSEDSKKDWYNWKLDGGSGYHEYKSDGISGIYYEGQFSNVMPDLNLDNPEVRSEIENMMKFWIDAGVDGFRLDAVLYYYQNQTANNVKFLSWLKETAENIKKDTYFVGEAWTSWDIISQYYESSCDAFFNFPSSIEGYGNDSIVSVTKGVNVAKKFGEAIESKEKKLKENNPNGRSAYFLSNHDTDRISKNLTGDFAKLGASIITLLPGNPFYYYGEEIGLKGTRTSPSTDAERRLPFIWSETDKTGECEIPDKETLGNIQIEQVSKGADDLLNEGYSLTNHYKKAINLRNKYSFIENATFEDLSEVIYEDDKKIILYKLSDGENEIIVCHNTNEDAKEVEIGDLSTKILDSINTTKKIPELESGKLRIGGYSTVILDVA